MKNPIYILYVQSVYTGCTTVFFAHGRRNKNKLRLFQKSCSKKFAAAVSHVFRSWRRNTWNEELCSTWEPMSHWKGVNDAPAVEANTSAETWTALHNPTSPISFISILALFFKEVKWHISCKSQVVDCQLKNEELKKEAAALFVTNLRRRKTTFGRAFVSTCGQKFYCAKIFEFFDACGTIPRSGKYFSFQNISLTAPDVFNCHLKRLKIPSVLNWQ